jgi:hypothetical protein
VTHPCFLDDYDPLAALDRWMADRTAGPDGDRRHWQLSPWWRDADRRWVYHCRLGWNMRGQIASVSKYGATVREAVWLAVEEFDAATRAGGGLS